MTAFNLKPVELGKLLLYVSGEIRLQNGGAEKIILFKTKKAQF